MTCQSRRRVIIHKKARNKNIFKCSHLNRPLQVASNYRHFPACAISWIFRVMLCLDPSMMADEVIEFWDLKDQSLADSYGTLWLLPKRQSASFEYRPGADCGKGKVSIQFWKIKVKTTFEMISSWEHNYCWYHESSKDFTDLFLGFELHMNWNCRQIEDLVFI